MKKLFLSAALTVMASASFAQSAPECGPTERVHELLANQYNEAPAFQGLDQGGHMIEVWVSDNSWSLLGTRPDGVSCLYADGKDWEQPAPKPNL